jgi:hypothetical protein
MSSPSNPTSPWTACFDTALKAYKKGKISCIDRRLIYLERNYRGSDIIKSRPYETS